MLKSAGDELTIADVARATGISAGTLRAWEQRYGFPAPERLASGYRRYRRADLEQIVRVVAERERGLSLPTAIERVRSAQPSVPSMFAGLRRTRPDLQPVTLTKRHLIALSGAIEDESCARAESTVLIGAFQRERFYRHSERRWRQLARGAEQAVVFADFKRLYEHRGRPVEIPIDRSHALAREWALICRGPGHGACLVAWELPAADPAPGLDRRFEAIFSADPHAVSSAAHTALQIAASQAPDLATTTQGYLESIPPLTAAGQLQVAGAITGRLLAALA